METISAEARDLHARALVMDLHADTLIPMRAIGYDLTARHSPFAWTGKHFGHCDLPRFAEGGATGQVFGLVTSPIPERGCFDATMRQIELLKGVATAHPDRLRVCWTAGDLDAAKRDGVLAAYFGIEGAHNLEGDADNVGRFADAGVRAIGLAHFSKNAVCAPAKGRGADNDAPLTDLGHQVVAAMGERRVIVDLAHVGRRAFFDALGCARGPVIVSHTGVAGVTPHWRNLDDEQIEGVAATGGVVGIIFARRFVGGRTIDHVLAHMDHVRKVVGASHVGLGSDYDGAVVPVRGLEDVATLPRITDGLLRLGWSPDEVLAALGGNVRRVLAAH
ncbi:MAG: dipeptidase [Myxococcales bacterium]